MQVSPSEVVIAAAVLPEITPPIIVPAPGKSLRSPPTTARPVIVAAVPPTALATRIFQGADGERHPVGRRDRRQHTDLGRHDRDGVEEWAEGGADPEGRGRDPRDDPVRSVALEGQVSFLSGYEGHFLSFGKKAPS